MRWGMGGGTGSGDDGRVGTAPARVGGREGGKRGEAGLMGPTPGSRRAPVS